MKYFKVEIAATSQNEAEKIIDTLLVKKMIAGGHFMSSETRHWWKGKIDIAEYYFITGYTFENMEDKIIDIVNKISSEEVPGILFYEIANGNDSFFKWIDENVE